MSKYQNTDAGVVFTDGGAVRVTIASNVGQGNGGTSLPCKKVYLTTDGTDVRVNIGAAATASLGLPVPWAIHDDTATQAVSHIGYLELAIDDVSKLYFYGTDAKVIDILYVR